MSLIKWLDKNFELAVLGVLLAVLSFFTFTNVVLRYLFQSGIVWAEELCKYCLIVSGFLSIPCWLRRRAGLRVDALMQLLPKKVRGIVDALIYLFMLVFFVFVFYNSVLVTITIAQSGQLSAALRMPMQYLYVCVNFGFALSIVRIVQVLVLMALPLKKEGM